MDVVACSKISTYETLFDYDTPRSSLNKRLSKSLERTNDFCKAIFNDLDSSKVLFAFFVTDHIILHTDLAME